ncbi:MAG: hypothetical protein QOG69_181, partial [Actinomycetota bacterium]|nr:hypothetical protein [Actinomycetota bacterium]
INYEMYRLVFPLSALGRFLGHDVNGGHGTQGGAQAAQGGAQGIGATP